MYKASQRCALLVTCLLGGSVFAAPRDPSTEATAHFRKGTNAYRAGLMDEAVAELTLAVKLKPTPNGIFALGQALREKGDLSAAAHQYRQYLVLAPTGPFAEQSRQFIAKIDETLAKTNETKTTPPRDVPAEPAAAETASAPVLVAPSVSTSPQTKTRSKWLWVGVGAGAFVVVALGVGLGVGLGMRPVYPTPTGGAVDAN